jgi:hypothetical protein
MRVRAGRAGLPGAEEESNMAEGNEKLVLVRGDDGRSAGRRRLSSAGTRAISSVGLRSISGETTPPVTSAVGPLGDVDGSIGIGSKGLGLVAGGASRC